MPKDKQPLARLQRINDIFQTRSSTNAVVKAEALAEELGISLRQLRTDMEVLREKGAPLEYDAVLKGWRYTHGQYFTILDNIPLTGEDLASLRIAVETLAKVNHLKDFSHLPEVFAKIHRAAKKWLGGGRQAVGKSVYFDPLPRYDGGKYLPFLLETIESSRRVEFQYQAYHATSPKTVVFDPWFLRHYDRRWYVGGYSHDPNEGFVRTFPLERIVGEPAAIGYFYDKPPGFDAESYWRHIYGITVPPGGVLQEVILQFSYLQGRYFLDTPFYEPYEVLVQEPDKLVVRLQIIPNIDLIRKLASLGAEVRVLAPESLTAEIRSFYQKALAAYEI